MHRPYGLGPRVPMLAISPWSRGGWVNSQVFDHTSVIRFIEQRFGVAEPNISAWRRAVCGDLTSVFDFTRPDDSDFLHLLPDTTAAAERARNLRAAQIPMAPQALLRPVQAAGARPSRALPYALDVSERFADGGAGMALVFANSGAAGVVLHVVDQLSPRALPRRFTVEAGKELAARWSPAKDGSYDLWVLGPNGFHRRFAGRLHVVQPLVRVQLDARGAVRVQMDNAGATPATFIISANAYGDSASRILTLPAHGKADHSWSVAASGNWYDFSVRVDGLPGYLRRFAGRIESGSDSISDPAMGGLAPG
jgi:phospholipase C